MKKYSLFVLMTLILTPLLYSQQWIWSDNLASDGEVYPGTIVVDMKVDEDNNIYQTGFYDSEPLTIGETTVANSGGWDGFIGKYDENGTLLWIENIGGTNRDQITGIEIIDDYLFVVGAYKSEDLFFADIPSVNHYDIFLAKYDLDGNLLKKNALFWGTSSDRPQSMLWDETSGELVIIGNFKTDINYDNGSSLVSVTTKSNGGKDLFVAKVDTSGIVNSFINWEISNSNSSLKDINISPDTNYYISGDLTGTIYFNATDSIDGDAVNSDALLFKLDKNLNHEWSINGGGTTFDHANSAISDENGNIYLAGKVEGDIQFDSDTSGGQSEVIEGFGNQDMFLAKYNPQGNLQWIKRKGSIGNDDAFGLALNDNLIQFCGNFSDTVIFCEDTLISSSSSDVNTGFAVFDLDGNEVGAQGIGGDGEDLGASIIFDNKGRTIISGQYGSTSLSIGDSTYTNTSGTYNGFIASYYYPFISNIIQAEEIACNDENTASLIGYTYFGVGPYTYQWSPNVTNFVDSLAFDLPSGTYSLTVTDSRDSVAVANFIIEEPSPLDVELVGTDLTCNMSGDGAIVTTVSGGSGVYNYSWSGTSGYDPTSKDQLGLSAGKFYLYVSDENECEQEDSIEILQPEAIHSSTVVVGETSGLSDGSIDLTVLGGATPYTYTWNYEGVSIPDDGNTLNGIVEGRYAVTVSDDNLCEYDTAILVSGENLRVTLLGTDISCASAEDGVLSAVIESGFESMETYTFDFQDSVGTSIQLGSEASISDLSPGKYFVILEEIGSGATAIDSMTLTQPDSINISFVTTDAHCFGESTYIYTTVSGGNPALSFMWSSGETSESLSLIEAAKYILTVTDANSCVAIDSAETLEPDSLGVSIIETISISCSTLVNGQLDAMVEGGSIPYSYQWNDNSSQTTSFAKVLGAGFYDVIVTDNNNCTRSASHKLEEPEAISLSAIDTAHISCYGIPDGYFGVFIEGGTMPYAYDWANSVAGNINYAEDLYPGTYSVTVSDSKGCGDSVFSFQVKAPSIALSLTEDEDEHVDNLCYKDSEGSFTASASGGWGNYEYTVNLIDWLESPTFSSLNARDYTITVRDKEGCEVSTGVTISENLELTINTTEVGSTVSAFGSGGTSPYEFSLDKAEWQATGLFEDMTSGVYRIYITDANLCGPDSSDVIYVTTQYSSINTIENAVSRIYPNPSDGKFIVEVQNLSLNGMYTIEAYSLSGIKVFEEIYTSHSSSTESLQVDLLNQERGIYLLVVNGSLLNTKLIIE